jgi:hypothetical protein
LNILPVPLSRWSLKRLGSTVLHIGDVKVSQLFSHRQG